MKIIIGGLIPLIILFAMTIIPMATLFFGDEIILETIPYDPRDLFRGDYVALSYKINEVDIDKFPEELKGRTSYREYINKKIYAVLKKEGEYYTVDYMTYERPTNKVYLTTKLNYFYPFEEFNTTQRSVRVNYNLDRYFVPENTGKDLENMSRRGELAARVKVFKGYAILVEVFPQEK